MASTTEEQEPNENHPTGIEINNGEEIEESEEEEVKARPDSVSRSARPGFASSEYQHKSVYKTVKDLDVHEAEYYCCPAGTFDKHAIALVFGVIAFILTAAGAWHCSYFTGATTPFSGNHYGLWTIEDIYGKCQLWDTIYGSLILDPYLRAARGLSMMAVVVGLSLITAMIQALRCRFLAGFLLVFFVICAILSMSIAPRFNVWAFFFLFSYITMVIIVRAIFIHPVHRAISRRGSRIIASMLILTFLMSILSLIVLNSDYCQCRSMEIIFDQKNEVLGSDVCENSCQLGAAGILTIIGSTFWLFAAIATFKFGVQAEGFQTEENPDVAGYNRDSMTTYAVKKTGMLVGAGMEAGKAAGTKITEVSDHMVGNTPGEDVEEEDSNNDNDTEYKRPPGLEEVLDDDEYGDDHKRTCCQHCCFDYRISKRSGKEKCIFWTSRVAQVLTFVLLTVIVVMLIGAKQQNDAAASAPSTSPNFITNVTCAFNAENRSAPWQTYDSPEAAHAANMTVAHCGACGECSNMWDTEVYLLSRKSISELIKKNCGFKAVLFGYNTALSCMKETLDFTDECNRIWTENVMCDTENCQFSCMKTLFSGFMVQNNIPISYGGRTMNACFHCDEFRCGTDFVNGAGLARRRMGIQSDIERIPAELCPNVDVNWLTYEFPPGGPSETSPVWKGKSWSANDTILTRF